MTMQTELAPTAAGTLQFDLVTDVKDLEALAPEWEALVAQTPRPEPMQDALWQITWLKVYGEERALAVGTFRDETGLVGVAPMVARTFKHRPGIPFRRLEFIGSGYDAHDGVFSEYLGLIAREKDAARVASAFAARLLDGGFGAFDECLLEMMISDAPATKAVRKALETTGVATSETRRMPAYYIDLPEDWDAYLASVHGKRRNWFRRSLRDFEKWAGADGYRIEHATDAASLEQGMRILVELHEERWTDDGAAGAFAADRFMAFHRDYAAQMLAAGRLDLKWLMVGQGESAEPVAVQYNFLSDDTVYFYQSGRKMDLPDNIRIGIVMHALSMQEMMARGFKEYDFMGGEAAYKQRFTSTTRDLVDIRIAPPSAREYLRRGVEGGFAVLRQARSGVAHAKQRLSELRQSGGQSQ